MEWFQNSTFNLLTAINLNGFFVHLYDWQNINLSKSESEHDIFKVKLMKRVDSGLCWLKSKTAAKRDRINHWNMSLSSLMNQTKCFLSRLWFLYERLPWHNKERKEHSSMVYWWEVYRVLMRGEQMGVGRKQQNRVFKMKVLLIRRYTLNISWH